MAVAASSDVTKFRCIERRYAPYHLIVVPYVVRRRGRWSSHEGHRSTVVAELNDDDAESIEPVDTSLCSARNFLEFFYRALRRLRLGVLGHDFWMSGRTR